MRRWGRAGADEGGQRLNFNSAVCDIITKLKAGRVCQQPNKFASFAGIKYYGQTTSKQMQTKSFTSKEKALGFQHKQ